MKLFSDKYAGIALRIVLGLTLLIAVSDRLGIQIASSLGDFRWGSMDAYARYLHEIFVIFPSWICEILAWGLTVAETVCGFLLLVGLRTGAAARLVGIFYLVFAAAVTLSFNFKTAADSLMFVAAFAALSLSGKSD